MVCLFVVAFSRRPRSLSPSSRGISSFVRLINRIYWIFDAADFLCFHMIRWAVDQPEKLFPSAVKGSSTKKDDLDHSQQLERP